MGRFCFLKKDCIFITIILVAYLCVAVTTVDSGSKALEFLGWNGGNSDEAIFSPKNNQVINI